MTKKATTPTTPDMRRCIGSTRFGIVAHEAPEDEFPAQPSAKDGLGRMCCTHWRVHTNALRKAAVARQAEETPEPAEPEDAPEAPAYEHTLATSLDAEGEPIESPAPRRTRRTKAQVETEADAA